MRPRSVCDNCRHRKRKCDGGMPCSACVQFKLKSKRTIPDCAYSEITVQRIKKSDPKDAIMARLEFLETKLRNLNSANSDEHPSQSSTNISSNNSLTLSPPTSNSSSGASLTSRLSICEAHLDQSISLQSNSTVTNGSNQSFFATNSMDASQILNNDLQNLFSTTFPQYPTMNHVGQDVNLPSTMTIEEIDMNSLIPEQERLLASYSTSLDPHFSSNLPGFGNIFESIGITNTANYTSIIALCREIQLSLLSCSELFATGKLDDGYKLLYKTFIDGKRNHIFKNATFHFPDNFPKEPEPIIESNLQLNEFDKMWAEKLWGICVKVDTYSSLAHKKPFVIHEDFHSHKLLPNEFVDWSLVPLDELIALGKKDSLLFGHNLETIRILRKIAYFDSISDTIQSKLEKKIIATNLHCMILRMLESTPQSQKHFNTLEEFVAKDLQLPIVGVAEPITTKLFIICMVNLHRSLLKQGIHLNFALSLSTPNNPIPSNSFTSQDILLLSLRAFKYLVSIRGEEGDCQAPYFNIDESTRIMDSFMNSVKACMAYQIADLVLSGFSIQPIQKLYLLETVDIVKFSIFPAVSMHGWKWPVASYFAAKIQASIRRANASTGLLTF